MDVEKKEAMGDVIEAVGGICHTWRRESKVIQDHLASLSRVPAMEFKEVGDVLGQLARSCMWFPRDAYGRAGTDEERKDAAFGKAVREINRQTAAARGIEGCPMCAGRSGSVSAATGHGTAPESRTEYNTQRGW